MCSMPATWSRSPRYTGRRLNGLVVTVVSTSAIGVLMSIAASRSRGTISWLAVRRPSRNARCRRTCSCGSSSPPSRLSAMSSSISSGECTWRWPVVGTRNRLSSSAPLPLRTTIAQENRRSDHCIGSTV